MATRFFLACGDIRRDVFPARAGLRVRAGCGTAADGLSLPCFALLVLRAGPLGLRAADPAAALDRAGAVFLRGGAFAAARLRGAALPAGVLLDALPLRAAVRVLVVARARFAVVAMFCS